MELIVLGEAEVKLILTESEMVARGLSSAWEDESLARSAISALVEEVGALCGFGIGGRRILVELYPRREGGCEIYVSKWGESMKASDNKTAAPYRRCLYTFESLSHTLWVIRILHARNYARAAELWAGEGGRWHLVLEANPTREKADDLSFIEEFGTRGTGEYDAVLFGDHARLLSRENTVARYAPLAD